MIRALIIASVVVMFCGSEASAQLFRGRLLGRGNSCCPSVSPCAQKSCCGTNASTCRGRTWVSPSCCGVPMMSDRMSLPMQVLNNYNSCLKDCEQDYAGNPEKLVKCGGWCYCVHVHGLGTPECVPYQPDPVINGLK